MALEIERLVASGGDDDIGETVVSERLGIPVHVERPVVLGLGHGRGRRRQDPRACRCCRPAALFWPLPGAGAASRSSSSAPLDLSNGFLDTPGNEGFELKVAVLQQLDRLGQLGRQHQRQALAHASRTGPSATAPSAVEREALAEVEAPDLLVGDQRFGRTREQDLAVVDDAGAVDDIERLADVDGR